MKIALFGVPGIKTGRHNLKDPRLDQADQLVEAQKKVHAQVELIDDKALADADAILVTAESKADLILADLEFIETRLGRGPQDAERAALDKLKAALESERYVFQSGLTPEETQALTAHAFTTNKPVIEASAEDLQNADALLLRAFAEAGYISFLTVGGKENRAWPLRRGVTAWDAAGTIHSDIQKGFIRAEIIAFSDFVEAGGETGAKRAGKLRLELKTYVMQDYDVVNFRFNK